MAKDITVENIKVGDVVRSYDFGKESPDCYVEGTVEEIGRLLDWQSCDVYKIKCTRKVFGGKERDHEDYYFPPVNGTPSFVGVCDYVTKIG